MTLRSTLLSAVAALTPNINAAAKAPSAVSLDYCSDQYLIALAEPGQIAAISRGGDDDYAYLRDEGADFPKIRASVEEAFAKTPELVLRQWGGGVNAQTAYARFGARVISLEFASDFDGVRRNIETVAGALGHPERGAQLIARMNARLRALAERADTGRRALYVTPGGVTAGKGTMIDAVMKAAGVVNIPAQADKSYWPPLPAEALAADPPELIVASFFETQAERANHWSMRRHPVMARLFDETPTVYLPADLVSCAAWFAVDAAEKIADAAEAATASP